jgi:acetolactate synthase-1/2/3 large subunit
MNVAEYLIALLEGLGVDRAFSVTGGMAMHINRAVAGSRISVVYGHHEQACVAAADGYARIHDHQRPGLAIVTAGPGVTNIITALASAHHDSVPLVVLAGQVKTADINRLGVRSYGAQEVPALELVGPVAKAALRYTPESVDDEALAAALATALAARKGPVFIEVPLDVQSREVPEAEARIAAVLAAVRRLAHPPRPLPEQAVAQLRDRWAASRQPVLFVGNGVRLAGITRARLRAVIDRLRVPVLTTWPSVGMVGADHPLHFGSPGGLAPTHSNRILQGADLLLFLGVRGDLLTTGFAPANFGKRADRHFIEADPAEARKFDGMDRVTCHLADLADAFAQLEQVLAPSPAHRRWVARCRAWRTEDRQGEALAFGGEAVLNARTVAGILSAVLRDRTLVATGSGYGIEGIARFFAPRHGADIAYGGHSLGSMGLGLPTAVGAAAAGHRPIVCVEGDGGLMFNLQELFTLQANPALCFPILVLNNGGYASIARSQRRAFNSEFGASAASGLATPDFRTLARAFGFRYQAVSTPRALRRALGVLGRGGAERVLLDVQMAGDDYRGPAIVTRFREDGTPYSSDLEDISWSR